jgi:transcriptional regulator with XRE-family HTH domain
MTSPESAQQERERLSTMLRQLRGVAALGSREAARKAGFSQSKLSKIENGMLLPSEADVVALCRAYRAPAVHRREVVALVGMLRNEIESARVILQRGAYRKQQEIGHIEAETVHFREFQPTYVLGLFQTSDYMRRVFAGPSQEATERAVQARLARQALLRQTTKRFHVIMLEAALRWRVGPPSVMIAQLDHIAEIARLPNVRMGLISWTTEASVFPGHAFHLYDDRLVIVGTLSATATIRDPKDVALYIDLFEKLDAIAAYADAAHQVLQRVRHDYTQLI